MFMVFMLLVRSSLDSDRTELSMGKGSGCAKLTVFMLSVHPSLDSDRTKARNRIEIFSGV